MEKISVIIPVYNSEKYLSQCIQSVIHQDHKNLEIIIVNDGSKDGSRQIIEEFSSQDERIRVLNKPQNEGLGAARNSGVSMATGNYIAFIDSDDWMDPNHLSDLYDLLKRTDSDISICNLSQFMEDKQHFKIHITAEQYYEKVYTPEEWLTFQYGHPNFISFCFTVTWGKLYKKSLFENVLYSTDGFGEDDKTTWKLYLLADRIAYMHKASLVYRVNSTSMTQTANQATIFSQEPVFERLAVLSMIGFDTSRELAAYEWRSSIKRQHSLETEDMVTYKNLKFHEQLIKKYRKS